jgi:hypothetical protein
VSLKLDVYSEPIFLDLATHPCVVPSRKAILPPQMAFDNQSQESFLTHLDSNKCQCSASCKHFWG